MSRSFWLVAGLAVLSGCAVPHAESGAERYFVREVKPVLQQHCLRCHNGAQPPPALNLSSRATAFAIGPGGESFIVPGKPDRSLLLTAVQRGSTHSRMMPRTDLSLTDDQIGMLTEWIQDGAFWPEGRAGELRHEPSGENR